MLLQSKSCAPDLLTDAVQVKSSFPVVTGMFDAVTSANQGNLLSFMLLCFNFYVAFRCEIIIWNETIFSDPVFEVVRPIPHDIPFNFSVKIG